jgi:hypothetical protein
MIRERYAVILIYSTSHAIRAEQILHRAGLATKLIPVPRHLSSDCGVCLRVERTDVEAARQALKATKVEIEGVHDV